MSNINYLERERRRKGGTLQCPFAFILALCWTVLFCWSLLGTSEGAIIFRGGGGEFVVRNNERGGGLKTWNWYIVVILDFTRSKNLVEKLTCNTDVRTSTHIERCWGGVF